MARVIQTDLAQWLVWELKRLKFQRQAKDMKALQQPFEVEKFEPYLREFGGEEKSVIVCGFRLYFDPQRESVDWKDHFIRETSSGRAEKIIAAQPVHDKFKIEVPKKK